MNEVIDNVMEVRKNTGPVGFVKRVLLTKINCGVYYTKNHISGHLRAIGHAEKTSSMFQFLTVQTAFLVRK